MTSFRGRNVQPDDVQQWLEDGCRDDFGANEQTDMQNYFDGGGDK